MNFKHASFGTVSHGTLRTEDLLDSFAAELEWQVTRNADYFQQDDAMRTQRDRLLCIVNDARECDPDSEDADYILNEKLIDALQEFAPAYAYFGAHPGDGSDFGFWLSENMQEDFDGLKVSDTSEVPSDYCGEVLCVNDHGNMTLYNAIDGTLIEVWSVV
jgi:hypothetical protein